MKISYYKLSNTPNMFYSEFYYKIKHGYVVVIYDKSMAYAKIVKLNDENTIYASFTSKNHRAMLKDVVAKLVDLEVVMDLTGKEIAHYGRNLSY